MEKEENPLIHKDKIENHCRKIQESVGNLTQILNKFLSVGKLEEGKIGCKWEKVNLHQLSKDIKESLKNLTKPGQEIVLETTLENLHFILDVNMITNILNNLLSNAIKYSNQDSRIHLILSESDMKLNISVSDHGLGIPLDDQKNHQSIHF